MNAFVLTTISPNDLKLILLETIKINNQTSNRCYVNKSKRRRYVNINVWIFI